MTGAGWRAAVCGLLGLVVLSGCSARSSGRPSQRPPASADAARTLGSGGSSPIPSTLRHPPGTQGSVPTSRPPATTRDTVKPVTPAAPAEPAGGIGSGGPATLAPTHPGPLSGKVVAIDPGHNGGNFTDTSFIDSPIFNGRTSEACDTTGTETEGGYTEAQFNFNVATDLATDLREQGATVVITRSTNTGVGPCVTERAAIGNRAHADVALSIHADGGPPDGRGFAVLEPVADGPNDAIVGPSQQFGSDLRNAFAAGTGEPVSTYDGVDGIQPRDDLGGINLSTVPKVFIECANMRNATDAALVVSASWQSEAATAIAAGIRTFLVGPA
ncbi:MAG: N-acetylmuramoyl-L-alanine amidase [Acidimicrobiales bacterium]